jgi:hypothetical protein
LEYNVLALHFVSKRKKITRAMKICMIIKINLSLISQPESRICNSKK